MKNLVKVVVVLVLLLVLLVVVVIVVVLYNSEVLRVSCCYTTAYHPNNF